MCPTSAMVPERRSAGIASALPMAEKDAASPPLRISRRSNGAPLSYPAGPGLRDGDGGFMHRAPRDAADRGRQKPRERVQRQAKTCCRRGRSTYAMLHENILENSCIAARVPVASDFIIGQARRPPARFAKKPQPDKHRYLLGGCDYRGALGPLSPLIRHQQAESGSVGTDVSILRCPSQISTN